MRNRLLNTKERWEIHIEHQRGPCLEGNPCSQIGFQPPVTVTGVLFMLHTLVFFTCIFLSKDIGSGHTLVSELGNWENWGGSLWSLWSERRGFSTYNFQHISWTCFQIACTHKVHTYRIKKRTGCTCKTASSPCAQVCTRAGINCPHMQAASSFLSQTEADCLTHSFRIKIQKMLSTQTDHSQIKSHFACASMGRFLNCRTSSKKQM